MLLLSPRPQVEAELPEALRAEEQLEYDRATYDFRSHVAALLHWAGPKIGFGSFDKFESSKDLELFQAKEAAPHTAYFAASAPAPRCRVWSPRRGSQLLDATH
eukprot:g9596.t1